MQKPQNDRTFSSIGILAFVVALLVAGALAAAPAIGTLVLSFQEYSMAQGFSSPFVGLRNYQTLLQAHGYGLSVLHSAQFAGLSALTLLAAGALAGYALRALAPRWLRHALCTLLLIPLLVPGEFWAQAFFAVFPTTAVQSMVALALWCGVKYVGLAALLTTAALGHGNRSTTLPLLSAAAVALGLFALLGLQDYAFLRQMSPLSAMRDNIDRFIFNQGIFDSSFSMASATTMVAIALRAVLLASVAFPVAALLRRLFPENAETAPTTGKDRARALLAAGAVALVGVIVLAVAARSGAAGGLAGNLAVYPLYVALALVGAAANTALCFCLARPLVTAKPAARVAATAAMLALTALGAVPVSMGEFMQFRYGGMVNTFFPVLLSGIGSTMGVWALVFAARAMGVRTDGEWFRRMWRPALALLAIAAALRMNDTMPSMLYLMQLDMLHPLLAMRVVAEQAGPSAANFPLVTVVTMAVPVVLLLAVRTVFTERETVGLAVPRK